MTKNELELLKEIFGDSVPTVFIPEKCGYTMQYKGTKPPTCCGGKGCKRCWKKYNNRRNPLGG